MDKLAVKRRERGEVTEEDIAGFASFNEAELLTLLRSENAVERSCAAAHLRKYRNPAIAKTLCQQMRVEKKLYTKIALCEALLELADLSIEPLIGLLGQIGKNQEIIIPETGFYKISYPLPRDIAARTLCRLGIDAIKPLEHFIQFSKDIHAVAQAIDAYGHIIYSDKIKRPSSILQALYKAAPQNDFMTYKIIRCLSGFHDEWSRSFLLDMLQTGCDGLQLEALRSLILLRIEIADDIQNDYSDEMQKLTSFLQKELSKQR